MDCRKPLVLALGLLGGVAGCNFLTGGVKDESVRKPGEEPVSRKPETAVALGDYLAQSACAPDVTPEKRKENFAKARLAYERALELDPNHQPAHAALARLHRETGDLAAAVPCYEKALELNNKDAALWYELGMCQGRLRRWTMAVESLGRAAELEPKNRQYVNHLGFALAGAERYQDSLECLTHLNGPAKGRYDLARMLRYLNKPQQAREQAKLALAQDPKLPGARQFLDELDGKPVQKAAHAEASPVPVEPEAMPRLEPVPGPADAGGPMRLPPLPVINGGSPPSQQAQ
jgi:tetratricopeptide (TPR) repeat protein